MSILTFNLLSAPALVLVQNIVEKKLKQSKRTAVYTWDLLARGRVLHM